MNGFIKQFFYISFLVAIVACSTTRKLSRSEVRQPSSVNEPIVANAVSMQRGELCNLSTKVANCSTHIFEAVKELCTEKIQLLQCPANLLQEVQEANHMFLGSERSMIEELTGRNCSGLEKVGLDKLLQSFLWSYETSGPIGRRRHIIETFQPQDEQFRLLLKLKKDLYNILEANRAIEGRLLANGDFVLPEKYLSFYLNLFKNSCAVEGDTVIQGFEVMDDLDKISNYDPDIEQKAQIDKLSLEIRTLINKSVGKLF